MKLQFEHQDVVSEGRSLFHECKDVFIAESISRQSRVAGCTFDAEELF